MMPIYNYLFIPNYIYFFIIKNLVFHFSFYLHNDLWKTYNILSISISHPYTSHFIIFHLPIRFRERHREKKTLKEIFLLPCLGLSYVFSPKTLNPKSEAKEMKYFDIKNMILKVAKRNLMFLLTIFCPSIHSSQL